MRSKIGLLILAACTILATACAVPPRKADYAAARVLVLNLGYDYARVGEQLYDQSRDRWVLVVTAIKVDTEAWETSGGVAHAVTCFAPVPVEEGTIYCADELTKDTKKK